jgi:hypothetical protein
MCIDSFAGVYMADFPVNAILLFSLIESSRQPIGESESAQVSKGSPKVKDTEDQVLKLTSV